MNHEYDDNSPRQAIDALPRDIQPERDLWPGIAARIKRRRPPSRRWLTGIAAAALIAFGALIATVVSRSHAPSAPAVATAPAGQTGSDTAWFDARSTYAVAAVRESTRLAPNTQAVLLRNLHIIEMSMANIRQALDKNPNDIRLHRLLYQLYQDEAALLDAAQRVQLQTTTRTAL